MTRCEKRTFYIPVAYEMYGRVPVEAKTYEEAFEIAEATIDELPLPQSAEYVEDSFEIDREGVVFDSVENTYN